MRRSEAQKEAQKVEAARQERARRSATLNRTIEKTQKLPREELPTLPEPKPKASAEEAKPPPAKPNPNPNRS